MGKPLKELRTSFFKGIGFAAGALTLWATVLLAQSMNNFISGKVVSASELNANFTIMDGRTTILETSVQDHGTRLSTAELSLPPVGTIMAWHKNLGAGAPGVAARWMECNGQPVTDPDSPFNGTNLPDLNNQRRFLRGNPVSGPMESSQFAQHTHRNNTIMRYSHPTWIDHGAGFHDMGSPFGGTAALNNAFPGGNANVGFAGSGSETRPINMSVVWIIRVK